MKIILLCVLLIAQPAFAQQMTPVPQPPQSAVKHPLRDAMIEPRIAPPGPQAGSNTRTGATDTLLASDCGNHVHYTNVGGVTVTIPSNLLDVCDVVLWQDGGVVTPKSGANVTFIVGPLGFTKTMGIGANIIINFLNGPKSPDGKARYYLSGLGAK